MTTLPLTRTINLVQKANGVTFDEVNRCTGKDTYLALDMLSRAMSVSNYGSEVPICNVFGTLNAKADAEIYTQAKNLVEKLGFVGFTFNDLRKSIIYDPFLIEKIQPLCSATRCGSSDVFYTGTYIWDWETQKMIPEPPSLDSSIQCNECGVIGAPRFIYK